MANDARDIEGAAGAPDYLHRWPGLYVREGERIADAPPEDVVVARAYPEWPDKGSLARGRRVTIMTGTTRAHPHQPVRVIHVSEVVEPGREVYVAGPKPVAGEFVDGSLVTTPSEGDPLEPATYNGPTLPSPAVDYNWEITEYAFEPGTHTVQWRPGDLQSNVLEIRVEEGIE